MDKTITAALLTIAAIVSALALINAVIPAMGKSTSALVSSNSAAAERLRTSTEIVYVVGDSANTNVYAWVKNTGSIAVMAVEKTDVFLQTPTTYVRVPYGAGADQWQYTLEGSATAWGPTDTIKITINLTALASGVYTLTIVLPNGVTTSEQFSV